MSRIGRVAVGGLGLAAGVATLAIARHDPGDAYGGDTVADARSSSPPDGRRSAAGLAVAGPALRAAAGCGGIRLVRARAGQAREVGSSLVFTTGLLAVAACAPLLADAALPTATGRARAVGDRGHLHRRDRAARRAGHGVVRPRGPGLPRLPEQPPAGARRPRRLRRGDPLGPAWPARSAAGRASSRSAPGARCRARGGRSSASWRSTWRTASRTNVLGNDEFDVPLWRAEAVALLAVAATVAWGFARTLRARAAMARLVVELGSAERSAAARDALARALGDDSLDSCSARWSRGRGGPVTPLLSAAGRSRRSCTTRRCSRDPGLVEEVVAAARLALENERFQAELRAQLEQPARVARPHRRGRRRRAPPARARPPRRRAAAARRALARAAAPARTRASEPSAEPGARGSTRPRPSCAHTLAELRELAHGIFPAMLGRRGPRRRVETLVESVAGRIAVRELPDERLDGAVEAAAYFVIAETLRRARATRAEPQRRAPGRPPRRRASSDAGLRRAADRPRGSRRRTRRDARGRPRRRPRARPRGAAMRIAIADDAMLMREGSRGCSTDAGFEVTGQGCATPTSCCAWSRRAGPTSRSSTSGCRRRTPTRASSRPTRSASRYPQTGVLVLSQYLDARYALRLLEHHPAAASATCSRSASRTSPCSPTRCGASARASA